MNNHKYTPENAEKSPGLVPLLRFPEFKNSGRWMNGLLEEVASFAKGKGISKSDISLNGILPCIRYGELYTHYTETIKVITSFTDVPAENLVLSEVNDVIIPASGETQEDIATASCVLINGVALGADLNIIRSNLNGVFLSYYLNNAKKREIAQLAQGISVVHLYASQLKKLSISIPSLLEQQRIADCLSSLDGLITAENQKLDALKDHKKGLTQQLFPTEGQTTPKYRFPKFQSNEAWPIRQLGNICKFVRGPFGGALKKDIFVNDGYAVYEQSHAIYSNFNEFRYFITKSKYEELKRFSVKSNDLIMSCSGTMGKFAVIPTQHKEGVINQALLKLSVKNDYDLNFIKYTLEHPINQEKLLSQSAGGAIKNVVGVGQLKEISLPIPSKNEQTKIADCLSSIDDLITTQTQKIESLKGHKKGLMQQLFPSSEASV